VEKLYALSAESNFFADRFRGPNKSTEQHQTFINVPKQNTRAFVDAHKLEQQNLMFLAALVFVVVAAAAAAVVSEFLRRTFLLQ